MTEFLDQIRHNAQTGCGPCSGCPAHHDTQGQYVNPGLLAFDGEVMFLTLDPSHTINWDRYSDWKAYNEEYSRQFASWRGGEKIRAMVAPLGLTLNDVWLSDSAKCPIDNSLRELDSESAKKRAAAHCSEYLEQEIGLVGPAVIVPMGKEATQRLLRTIFDRDPGNLKPGTQDCGKIIKTDPPVVVSPHWSHGWLDRSPNGTRNLEVVRAALKQVYSGRE